MANPLEAWKQHATASEHMDLAGVGSHQKKGWNFAENFPSLVPGSGVTATQWVGPALATGYQLGQEGLRSILPEKWGGTDIGFADAMKKGWTEAKQNIQGMGGKGFDKDEYDEWMHAQGYAPEYDFSGIAGQTAVLGLPELFGMIIKGGGISKQAIKKAIIKDQISKQIGKKVKPVLTGILTGGKAAAAAPTSHEEAQATGGDYHGGQKSTVDGQTTDWGPSSHMIARGGLAQRAPRYANGGLIDFFRYGGFIG